MASAATSAALMNAALNLDGVDAGWMTHLQAFDS